MIFLEQLAARRRFGIQPGLDTIRGICAELDHPESQMGKVIHVAGTNGKGAVCAMLDSCLRTAALGRVGRYTSPHLVKLNERFFLNGAPVDDAVLERLSTRLETTVRRLQPSVDPTFFEALTAVAFLTYAEAKCDYTVLETGLGGRLDATNVCAPVLSIITRIGRDHCEWLGNTVEQIAAEKGGIVKPGVPVLLAANEPAVRTVIERIAAERAAPFYYAPELASAAELPRDLSLAGAFNRENALTALAALKVLLQTRQVKLQTLEPLLSGFGRVTWPGRFQRIGDFIVDGAHNPPAARALAESLTLIGAPPKSLQLIAGFCGDKEVGEVLSQLAPFVRRGFAVRTHNPRSLTAAAVAERMRAAGIAAEPCESLATALAAVSPRADGALAALICGSLFLAGAALVELGAYPWGSPRFDPAETLHGGQN